MISAAQNCKTSKASWVELILYVGMSVSYASAKLVLPVHSWWLPCSHVLCKARSEFNKKYYLRVYSSCTQLFPAIMQKLAEAIIASLFLRGYFFLAPRRWRGFSVSQPPCSTVHIERDNLKNIVCSCSVMFIWQCAIMSMNVHLNFRQL